MPRPDQKRRPSPFSLWLSAEERTRLAADANGAPLGAYIKSKIFAEPAQRVRRHSMVRDQRTAAQLLACLGASGLAVQVKELADAARSGSLDCDAETAAALRNACTDIAAMRSMLVATLGLKPKRPPRASTSTPCRAFNPAATGGAGR